MTVYPSRMAPVDAKLRQNAFQTIPNVTVLDAKTFLLDDFFHKLRASDPNNIGNVLRGPKDSLAWSQRNVLPGMQGMSCVEHKECFASKTWNVVVGTQRVSCLETTERFAWNQRFVLLCTGNAMIGTEGMSCPEHDECLVWNTLNL